MKYLLCIEFLIALQLSFSFAYKIGVGRSDATGPPVEITFMGYAQLSQKGEGIHLRQFSRAFIFDDGEQRVVFVSVDAGMMGHAVKSDVIRDLQRKYGPTYNMDNVMISGTHTHGTPGGFLTYLLYDLTSMGFVVGTKNALVRGITQSIINAHNNMKESRLFLDEIEVNDANINRSPTAYKNNPDFEKAQYKDNTDKKLVQLKITDKNGRNIRGAINWYAVHPTSMNNTNRLVTSDNVGFASVLLEQEYNQDELIGKGDFVGAFASTNLGDVSPNIMGPKCQRTGLPCDVLTSSCPDKDQCIASGPGSDMFESTKIIATRIYKGASQLLKKQSGREIKGPIGFSHQYVDMSQAQGNYYNPRTKRNEKFQGCLPAMGYSFAAGTTDGPGSFDFKQATTTDNPLWNIMRDFIAEPSNSDINCQAPKPILLATGRATYPYEWQPKIVPTQLFLIGDLSLIGVPGEFTTMSGRRIRSELKRAAKQQGREVEVIVAGLTNMYTSYITTPEEYQIQRYEGASTLYGPHTLTIYIQQYQKLLLSIFQNITLSPGPYPPNQESKQISLISGVIYDGHGMSDDYGYVKVQPYNSYSYGDVVHAKFVAGNPRNNMMHDSTYFTVDRKLDNGDWKVIATDANWETRFIWRRISTILGMSDISFFWQIPENTPKGTYRIRHFGHYKYILGGIFPYNGSTKAFIVE